jgi:predicted O-methyltransferase YrrM
MTITNNYRKSQMKFSFNDTVKVFPTDFQELVEETQSIEFDQGSDPLLGSLLATLSATKPGGCFLELGTGSGLSTAWILHGMDSNSSLTTIDRDENLASIAKRRLGKDQRVKFIVGEGEELIKNTKSGSVDFIFADAWPGKYFRLAETLSLLKSGGIYIVDDMLPRKSWPAGHGDKANKLVLYLESRDDLLPTKISWSSGIIICTKK